MRIHWILLKYAVFRYFSFIRANNVEWYFIFMFFYFTFQTFNTQSTIWRKWFRIKPCVDLMNGVNSWNYWGKEKRVLTFFLPQSQSNNSIGDLKKKRKKNMGKNTISFFTSSFKPSQLLLNKCGKYDVVPILMNEIKLEKEETNWDWKVCEVITSPMNSLSFVSYSSMWFRRNQYQF